MFCNGGLSSALCAAVLYVDAGPQTPASLAHRGCLLLVMLATLACCCADTWASELGMLAHGSPMLITTGQTVPAGTNGGVTWRGTGAALAGGAAMGAVAAVASELSRAAQGGSPCAIQASVRSALQYWWRALGRAVISGLRSYAGHSFGTSWKARHFGRALEARWQVVALLLGLGLLSGVVGCMLDSVLGALVQFSGWDDEQKRVVSAPDKGVKHIAGRHWLDNNAVNFVAAAAIAGGAAAVFALPAFS